ncbi:MAG: sigma-54-dependent Fis family transcriptional regulator [Nitrospirae bacterium]|nr:sigma-54-dependent Fis family transcriptional regulator [Nitrospirota bacterium]
MNKILIVDDERDIRRALEFVLSGEGYSVETASNGIEAVDKLKNGEFDLVITDIKMDGLDGFGVLEQSKKISQPVPVIMITAFGSVESAVEAMKLGAADYIVKPFMHDEIKLTIGRILEHSKLSFENMKLRRQLSQQFGCKEIVGLSESISKIFETIEKVGPTTANVLITGESGTGKGLVAETIHCTSPRRDMAFMSLNCAAIPEGLLESELFGYKKGAFTGATTDKPGLIVMADGGTLFLDEIGDMPMIVQSKLLKVLESGEVMPLGDTKKKTVDVRIISATNKDIEACINEKTFREDLYYRLNVIEIKVPPLRQRADDIPILVSHFLNVLTGTSGANIKEFDQHAMKALISYKWPGNVRELRNVIERAIILSSGQTITINDLPVKLITGSEPAAEDTPLHPLKSMVSEYEREVITNSLRRNKGNKELVVHELGIDLATLYRKMHKYSIKE